MINIRYNDTRPATYTNKPTEDPIVKKRSRGRERGWGWEKEAPTRGEAQDDEVLVGEAQLSLGGDKAECRSWRIREHKSWREYYKDPQVRIILKKFRTHFTSLVHSLWFKPRAIDQARYRGFQDWNFSKCLRDPWWLLWPMDGNMDRGISCKNEFQTWRKFEVSGR